MINTPSSNPTSLRGPKCDGPMRTYERAGIHVDQCIDCRGAFLDRGELEHLVSLEARAFERVEMAAPRQPGGPDGRHDRGRRGSPEASRGDSRERQTDRSAWDNELDDLGWPGDDGLELDWGREARDRGERDRRETRPDDRPGGRRRSLLGDLFEVFGE